MMNTKDCTKEQSSAAFKGFNLLTATDEQMKQYLDLVFAERPNLKDAILGILTCSTIALMVKGKPDKTADPVKAQPGEFSAEVMQRLVPLAQIVDLLDEVYGAKITESVDSTL